MGILTGKNKHAKFSFLILLSVVFVLASACDNRMSRRQGAANNNINLGGVGDGGGNDPIRVFNVVPANTNPNGSLTLIGDESIGLYCGSVSGTGPGDCKCRYEFNTSVGNQLLEADTEFFSTNEITCSASSLLAVTPRPSIVQVRISAPNVNALSNVVNINLNSGGGSFLNLRDETSFLPMMRWQWRRQHEIFHAYCDDAQKCPIDPFQSESNLLSFPVNYYTTNPGMGLVRYAQASDSAPDPLSLWKAGYNPGRKNISPWQNHYVYSFAPDTRVNRSVATGNQRENYLVYDPEREINLRQDALLAKVPAGVFTTPVEAYESPGTLTTLGYAAQPFSDQNGDLQCPTEPNSKPDGFQWVLIFPSNVDQFPGMEYVRFTEQMASGGHTAVACNPGNLVDTSSSSSAVSTDPTDLTYQLCAPCTGGPPCTGLPTGSLDNIADQNSTTSANLSARLFADKVFLTDTPASACMRPTSFNSSGSGVRDIPYWTVYSTVQNPTATQIPVGNMPWNFDRNGGGANPIENQIIQGGGQNIITQTITMNEAPNDYLFVVTPTGVRADDIESDNRYKFFRYKRKADCQVFSPNINPNTDSTCQSRSQISGLFYSVSRDRIGVPSGPGADDYYPLCAIQKL